MADAPSPKLNQTSYRPSDITLEEAQKAPGGIEFIAEKNRIDETYSLPVNAARKATWGTHLSSSTSAGGDHDCISVSSGTILSHDMSEPSLLRVRPEVAAYQLPAAPQHQTPPTDLFTFSYLLLLLDEHLGYC